MSTTVGYSKDGGLILDLHQMLDTNEKRLKFLQGYSKYPVTHVTYITYRREDGNEFKEPEKVKIKLSIDNSIWVNLWNNQKLEELTGYQLVNVVQHNNSIFLMQDTWKGIKIVLLVLGLIIVMFGFGLCK